MSIEATQNKARQLIEVMLPGTVVTFPISPQTSSVVTGYVSHPKRTLSVNSFANAAKRLGWVRAGTKSASNRNEFIVLYINVDAITEIKAQSSNRGLMFELRVKA